MTETTNELIPILQRLSKSFRVIVDIRLAEIGLVSGQDQLLEVLPDDGAMQSHLVAKRLNVRPSTVSKMVDILTREGFLVRMPDPEDGRAVLISLTELGRTKRIEVRAIRSKLEAELADPSDQNRFEVLKRLEKQVTRHLLRMR